MERAIARLGERITIQKCTVVEDRYKNHLTEWADYYSCHAYASTYTKEEETGVVTTDERGISFEIRYCSEVSRLTSTDYRVIFHGDVYNISSVDMMNYQKRSIKLLCRKERSGTDGQRGG